ncbi:MAG: Inner membrane protein YgbE [Candidatus Erwinia impunctatus]|nr:Inner membrane protein YgbE [Culicoides impunctatus]
MPNVIPVLNRKIDVNASSSPEGALRGAVIGAIDYGLVLFAILLFYGDTTLFFFLYTWPFFLALLPLSVLTGLAASYWFGGRVLPTLIVAFVVTAALFWSLFFLLFEC